MSRDYIAEMRDVIDSETGDVPYVSAIVAEHIVEKLRETDPDLLTGWLNLQAVNIVRDAINYRDRSDRAYARATAGRSVFATAAARAEAGDTAALAGFMATVYVVENGTRVRLAQMRKPDLLWVGDDYQRRAADLGLHAAFLKALAKKVGTGRVADHFDDDKLTRLWNSISERH